MSSFLLKKKAYAGSFAFLFQFEEIGCRIASNACGGLWRQCFIGNNVQRLVSPVQWRQFWPEWQEAWKSTKKVEDCQLLFWTRTIQQKMLAEQLDVSQAAISMRLHVMGEVQKIGKWVPHELNDRQMEWRQNTCQILLARQKRKSFLHRIVTGDEKWIYFQNPNARNLGLIPPNHQHLPQDQIASDGRRCCAFDGIRRVSSITSC